MTNTVEPRQFELEGTSFTIRIGEVFKLVNYFFLKIENSTKKWGKRLLRVKKIGESGNHQKKCLKSLYNEEKFLPKLRSKWYRV